ncbi:MAG: magnesium transporter MgtE N-terminal domain-containing protein [Acidimicrobiales bacterium]
MPKDPKGNEGGKQRRRRPGPITTLRDQLAVRRKIASDVISLTNLLGRPVLDVSERRVGRVSDVVVHWEAGTSNPRVTGVLVSLSRGFALVNVTDVKIEQSRVRSGTPEMLVAKPVRQQGDIALSRDVLDHQLVDVEGVQVVRAADVYLLRTAESWELAGVDVSFWAFARRLLPRSRTCPPPHRSIDWADLQTFVPRETHAAPTGPIDPAAAAGTIGSGIQLGSPAKDLRRLNAKEVAAIIADLGRRERTQVAGLVTPSAAAEALRQLSQKNRDALLEELSEGDRARLLALLKEDDAS